MLNETFSILQLHKKNEWQENVHQISTSKETSILQLKCTDVVAYHVSYKNLLAWHLSERHFTFWWSGCCYVSFFCFSKHWFQFEKGTCQRVSWKFRACVNSTAEGLFTFISYLICFYNECNQNESWVILRIKFTRNIIYYYKYL